LYALAFLTSAAILLLTLSCLPAKGYALEITNQKSGRHVEAADSGAFFVPAPGLVLADSLDGFESKERNIQVIVANFGAPLDEMAKGFTEESFKSMGMELKSRGEFTVNGMRAFLYKILHPNDGVNWGKWIMLAENGDNTIVVNASFVSGDAEAAGDLEVMLKGVYMESPRPVSSNADASPPGGVSERPVLEDVSGHTLSGDVRAAEVSLQSVAEKHDVPDPEGAVSGDVRSGGETGPVSSGADSTEPGGDVSADLAKQADAGEDTKQDDAAASNDVAASPDDASSSEDKPVRKTKVRIITENGIVTVGDAPTGMPGGENGSGE
jgi:hypothetical protein